MTKYIVEVFMRVHGSREDTFESYSFNNEEDAIKSFDRYVKKGCLDYRHIPAYKKGESLCVAMFGMDEKKEGVFGHPYFLKSHIWKARA